MTPGVLFSLFYCISDITRGILYRGKGEIARPGECTETVLPAPILATYENYYLIGLFPRLADNSVVPCSFRSLYNILRRRHVR